MATSSSYDFSQTRDQIISRALRLAGAIAAGETPGSQLVTDAAIVLNTMVKHWQGTGIHIWRATEVILLLQQDTIEYALSNASTSAHATESHVETSLSVAAASGASTFTVASATGLAASQFLAIELDSGAFQFTTINGAPSGTTVTPAATLTGAAASGNRVIAYTTKLVRPLKILSARRYNFDSDIEVPLTEFDRIEYQELPQKTSESTPTGFYYNRRGGANSTGLFYAWPQPTNVDDAIKMTVARPIQDFDAAGDNPDLPDEWYQAITYNLACILGPEYDCPLQRYAIIEKKAGEFLAQVTWNEAELGSIQFVPDMR